MCAERLTHSRSATASSAAIRVRRAAWRREAGCAAQVGGERVGGQGGGARNCSPGQQMGAAGPELRGGRRSPARTPYCRPACTGHPALPTIRYVPSQTHAGRCRSLIRSCQPPQLASATEPSSSSTALPPEMRPGRSSSVTEPVAVSRGAQIFHGGFANHALRESRNLLDSVSVRVEEGARGAIGEGALWCSWLGLGGGRVGATEQVEGGLGAVVAAGSGHLVQVPGLRRSRMTPGSRSSEAEECEGAMGVAGVVAEAGGDVLRSGCSEGSDGEVAPGGHGAGCVAGAHL